MRLRLEGNVPSERAKNKKTRRALRGISFCVMLSVAWLVPGSETIAQEYRFNSVVIEGNERLRPGQKIDIGTGTVLEPYEQSPSEGTQGAFLAEPDGNSAQPVSTPTPSLLPAGAGDSRATQAPADGSSARAEVLERIDALTKAAKAAVGIGAAPASP